MATNYPDTLVADGVYPIVEGPVQIRTYAAGTRPAATALPAGTVIYNSTTAELERTDGATWTAVGGGGSTGVTSVGLTTPSWLTVAGSPVTGAGTLAVSATTGQTANRVLASPDGSTGAVSLRALVANDIPSLPESKITNLTTDLAAKATDSLVVHLAGAESISGAKTFAAGTLKANNAGGTFATTLATTATAARTWTLPDASDTAVGLAVAQTLTNKTMSGASNTFSSIPESAITNLTTDLAAKATDSLVVHLAGTETVTGTKTFNSGTVKVNNSGNTFATTLASAATAARTWTIPDATDTAAALGIAQTFTKAQGVASVALTDGTTISTDASLGNVFTVTLGGNRTLANPTNLVSGFTYQWIVTQDGTGTRTLAYGTAFTWAGGTAPTLSTAASSVDIITATYDGTKLRCVFSAAFA